MKNLPSEKPETILDHIPTALGRAAIDVCLSSFPLALVTINLVGSLTGKYVSMRNEKQIEDLLKNLKQKIDHLDKEQILVKEHLKQNVAYQEIAHKRLSVISSLDSKEDLELSASLIALCGALTGENPKDKYLLSAIGEISANEVRLFILGNAKRKRIEKLKSEFNELERRDAQSEVELTAKISVEFFNEGEELLGLYNFTHLLGRLHSFGLIETPNISGFSDYNTTPKVFSPKLTPIGDYFVTQLEQVGFDVT